MKILGLDTSISVASVALSEDGRIVAEECYPRQELLDRSSGKPNHTEIILPLIGSVLQRARVGVGEIAGIAVSIGPGSFTGVRIGLSTVKGLAYGADMPVVGISTLHAIAARVSGFDGIVCPILDARKREVYAAVFRKQGNQLERLMADGLMPMLSFLEELRGLAPAVPYLFIGDRVTAWDQVIQESAGLQVYTADEREMPSVAASVALLSQDQFIHRRVAQLEDLVPVYLRRPECASRIKLTVSS